MKIALPFGFSFEGVLRDAVAALAPAGQLEALCLVLGPRDGAVQVDGSVVTWTDRGETRSVDTGVTVTPVRLEHARDGVLDLTAAIAAVQAFGPDVVVLNGGTTPVQGVLWGQDAPRYDVQRDGVVELRV